MTDVLRSAGVRPVVPWLVRGFGLIGRRELRRSFRAVRLLSAPPASLPPRTVVYLNHPSWWDPLVCMLLAQGLFQGRAHYAPMSAESMRQYPLFRWMGLYPVDQHRLRGVAQFLRGGEAILQSGGVLWVTAQGSFRDVRERPASIKAGLSSLLQRLEKQGNPAMVIPLAIEYTFWNEKTPEVLASFGEAFPGTGDAVDALAARLETVQDELATAAMTRDPAIFRTLLRSRGRARLHPETHGTERQEA
jgi:1-acyl-sn-glycerol-3-phosphate acyltransferase